MRLLHSCDEVEASGRLIALAAVGWSGAVELLRRPIAWYSDILLETTRGDMAFEPTATLELGMHCGDRGGDHQLGSS